MSKLQETTNTQLNRSWDMTSTLHIHTRSLFQVELEKKDG